LTEASDASHADAVRKAAAFLMQRSKVSDEGAVTRYVEQHAEIADKSFTYQRVYRHFTLLRLSRTYAEAPFLQAFLIARRGPLDGKPVRLRLQLDSIHVVADGSNGTTGWTFEARVKGGRVLFTLPARKPTIMRARTNTSFFRAAARCGLEPKQPASRIEIAGQRTSGLAHDVAVGSEHVSGDGPVTISVRIEGGRDGSFVFFLGRVDVTAGQVSVHRDQ
jgi:hypothetical protein